MAGDSASKFYMDVPNVLVLVFVFVLMLVTGEDGR